MTDPAPHPPVTLGGPPLLSDLSAQPTDRIAEAHDTIRRIQAELKDAQTRLEEELRIRLVEHDRAMMVAGDWEIKVESVNESVWDGDELEFVLRDLVDQGTLKASELTGIIRREPVVSRTDANRLVERLTGEARMMVEGCRQWRRKGRGRVRVTRSVALIPEQQQPGEHA